VLSKDPVQFIRKISPVDISDDDTYPITLHAGWNIISIPFNRAVAWQDVQNFNDFSSTLFSYKGSFFEADSLQPFEAYYVYNQSDTFFDLEVPYSQTSKRKDVTTAQPTAVNAETGLQIAQLFATALDDGFSSNVEILYPQASSSNNIDYHPPLDLIKFGIVFVQKDEENREKILHSVNGSLSKAGHYTVEVKSVSKSDLQWSVNLQNLPSDFAIMLVNTQNGRTKILQRGDDWLYAVKQEKVTLEVYTGTLAQLKDVESEILPPEITLE